MEERICRNLKYNLEQMKIADDKEGYLKIIDSIIIGPDIVRNVKPDNCTAFKQTSLFQYSL